MKKWLAVLLCLCMVATMGLPVSLAAQEQVITLMGDKATWTCKGVTLAQNVLTIHQAGTYVLTGEWNGQVYVEVGKDDDVELLLRGVSVQNAEGPAVLIEEAEDVTLRLEEGSENRIISGEYITISAETAAAEEASGAAIHAKCDLKIKGEGSLFVGGYIHQGIRTSKDLDIKSGMITIEAVGSGIRCKDKLEMDGGTISIVSGGDGIHAATEATDAEEADGHIIIRSGTLSIEAFGDGIQSETTLLIEGGALDVVTGGGSELSPARNSFGGGWMRGMKWDMDDASDTTDSTKGLKAAETLSVTGGTVKIDSYDDSLHAAGKITVSGGSLTLMAGDDGMHSDTELLISGGTVDVQSSYEGIEAHVIHVTGGHVTVNAEDDGFNANGGVSSFGSRGGMDARGSFGGFGGMQGGKFDRGRDGRTQDNGMTMPEGTPPAMPQNQRGNEQPALGAIRPENMPLPDNAMPEGIGERLEGMPDAPFVQQGDMQGAMPPDMQSSGADQSAADNTLPSLIISGGVVYVNAQGDGLDSNGDLLIEGGVVTVDGPSNSGNGALDSGTENGGSLRVTGGIVLAIGATGMAECFDSTSTQPYISINTRWNAGDKIVITDADGNELISHEAAKSGQSVIFSSPDLTEGASVKVIAGGNETEATAGFEETGYTGFGRHGW